MIMSTLFIVIAVMAALISGQVTRFTVLMFCGFGFSWIGDFILGKGSVTKIFVTGAASFLVAHIFFIAAMISAENAPPFFDAVSVTVFIVSLAFGAVLCLVKKGNFRKLLPAMTVYFAMLSLMFAKACSLGVSRLPETPGAMLMPIGALLFVCSDVTLGMMYFNMHKRSYRFQAFSTTAYFMGQMLAATSMMFIY